MRRKSFLRGALAGLVIGLVSPVAAEVKIALDTPPTLEHSGTYVWAHTFSEHLKANGMDPVEYERGALGGEAERLDQVSQGLLEVSMSDNKQVGTLDGTIFGLLLPYFFADDAQLDQALYDGGMLDRVNAEIAPKGVRIAGVVYSGGPAGIFTTKTPVNTIEDLSGLRMRALDEAQIAIFESWGSQGTIVSWNEVPNALQTGIADGYINPPFVPLLFGHTDFIKHFTDVSMTPSTRLAIISEDWYQGLSEDERKIVDDAISAANAANREWLAGRTVVIEQLEEAGISVIRLDEAARDGFREASKAGWATLPMPDGALDAWIAAIGQ